MRDDGWHDWDDEALERLLIERWLLRGLMLGVILLAAIGATWTGARGMESLADRITVGALLLLALVAAGVGLVMRQQDLRIHRELRRRHAGSGPTPGGRS